MTPRRLLAVLVSIALGGAAACVVPSTTSPTRTLRVRPRLDDGPVIVKLGSDGTMAVTLPYCRQQRVTMTGNEVDETEEPCPDPLDPLTVVAPWGRTVHVPVANVRGKSPTALVTGPWGDAAIDPLDRRSWSRVSGPWRIEHPLLRQPFTWVPSDEEVNRLVYGIGASLGIDPSVGAVSDPPELVVDGPRVSNNELLAGGPSILALTVENRGQGSAYRLYATVRSSVPALHGLQFSIGKLAPGQAITRHLPVELPANVTESSAMLVLAFSEANGFQPANVSKRFPIKVVATAPRLAIACAPASGSLDVDAGEVVRMRCTITNEGGQAARGVAVTGTMGGAPASASVADIPARRSAVVEVPVRVPSNAAVDERLAVELVVTESSVALRAATRLEVIVRRPRLCPTGKLDRAQYLAKRRALEEARTAGDLTAEEFDRYDAELVGCLE
ncbi:MAG: hypothetical protein K8M05_35225 [Deltaproteobacteria bacterium]|nr:hypothetical protein [Kofleriaceae bacterium]